MQLENGNWKSFHYLQIIFQYGRKHINVDVNILQSASFTVAANRLSPFLFIHEFIYGSSFLALLSHPKMCIMAPGPPSPPSSNIKASSQSPSHRASRSSAAKYRTSCPSVSARYLRQNHFKKNRALTLEPRAAATVPFAPPSSFFHNSTNQTPEAMAPKRAPVPRRQESKSVFSTAYTAVTDPENRSVVTGVAMFAVSHFRALRSLPPSPHESDEMKLRGLKATKKSRVLIHLLAGWCRFPPQQLERVPSSRVKSVITENNLMGNLVNDQVQSHGTH